MDQSSIPVALREAVRLSPQEVHSTPTTVRFLNDDQTEPGFVVGSQVSGPLGGRYPVFFVFSFADEQQTLATIRTAMGLGMAVVIAGMGLVSYFVTLQTLRPIRQARQAAERLAAGELTEPMPIKGTDDLARLAVSMNHMANQLRQRIRQLERLSNVQQRFVSDVSHELRTPLTTVRMAVDVLYDSKDSFDNIEQRSVVLMKKEIDQFELLLADLLEISRFDAGAAVLSPDEEDITELVESAISSLGKLADSAGTEIRLHTHESIVAQVDGRRIGRLIRNLLSNAIAHGEGKPIDVRIKGDDQAVAFTVRDHGVGFSHEEARQLFNRFWRADPARARKIGGTGLGLAISREDVRLHQGWIQAWGEPGQGAQFRVTLPRKPGDPVTRSPLSLRPADAQPGISDDSDAEETVVDPESEGTVVI
jgi:two-component system sensor histidine kinase MtrB